MAVPSEGHAAAAPSRFAPEGEATRLLYERHQRKILSFCKHQLGSREEAEDATQITFLNAFRGIKRGATPEFESAWLFKIAHNVCLTKQRNSYRRRLVEVSGDFELIEERIPAHEGDTDELFGLETALRAIPEQQRHALLLREWQGLTYKEIADEMRLSQAAVETLLFRARRSLADALTTDPSQRRKRGRPRTTSNAGSGVAAIKSLIVGGSVKVAATVATVAATSVVTVTPAVRHDVINALNPRQASHQPAAHAPVRAAHVAAPVVALAQQLTSVKPAPQPPGKKASIHTHVATRATRSPAVAAESEPSEPVDRAAAAATPAVAPTPHNPLPLVPVPAPAPAPASSDPASLTQDAPPPEPAAQAAPAVSPSMPSAPPPQSAPSPVPSPTVAAVAITPVVITPIVTTAAPTTPPTRSQRSGASPQPLPTTTTQTVNAPAVTTPTVTMTVTTTVTAPAPASPVPVPAPAPSAPTPVPTTTTQTTVPVPPPFAPAPVITLTPAPVPVPVWGRQDHGRDNSGRDD